MIPKGSKITIDYTASIVDKDKNVLESKFWSGKEARHIRREFRDKRSQINAKVGSGVNTKYNFNDNYSRQKRVSDTYTKMRKFSNRENNWMEYANHQISVEIIRIAQKYKNPVIRVENLKGIRGIGSKELQQWTYAQLQGMIEYKAKTAGIKYEKVAAKYTSQMCSKCGFRSRDNRKSQAGFKCMECGISYNADFNAAINIAVKLPPKKKDNYI